MNKKILFAILPFLALGIVGAAYLVNSFVLTTDVYEPFTVEYAIIGDGSTWDGTTLCDDPSVVYQPGTNVDVGGLYPGEGRMICTKITNAGEGFIDYTFSGEVVSGLGNFVECESAFGNPSVSGTVGGLTTITDGQAVIVAGDADPVEDCQIELSVTRG